MCEVSYFKSLWSIYRAKSQEYSKVYCNISCINSVCSQTGHTHHIAHMWRGQQVQTVNITKAAGGLLSLGSRVIVFVDVKTYLRRRRYVTLHMISHPALKPLGQIGASKVHY